MDTLIRDIRVGTKLLWKDRGFAITAVFTLAVCIGANTAVFTIVNSVLLRPLPVPEADSILLMSNQYPNAGVADSSNSGAPDYYDRLREVNAFGEQAMFNFTGQTIEINNTPERVRGMSATPSMFRLIKVAPLLGRTFHEDEAEVGNDQKIILAYGLWQQLFSGDPNAPGRELRMSGRTFSVIGVMPREFLFVDPEVRFWIPQVFTAQDKSDQRRHSNNWYNIGRLKPGATLQQAQEQVNALNAANLERFPQWKQIIINAGFHTRVERLQDMLVRDVKGTLYMLWAGAAFVLLIGGVNIANLVLARSSLRMKELATRVALGAARGRVARQLVTESVLVTIAGGLGGLLFGAAILRGLTAIGLDRLPRAAEVRMDLTVVLFALAVSLAAGIVIGLVPIGHLMKVNLSRALHEQSRAGSSSRSARAIRRALVVAQIGFACLLLIGAGLLLGSFRKLLDVDPGFKPEGVLTAATSLPRSRYPNEAARRVFFARALDAIRAVPGVTTAGAATSVPFDGNSSDSVILAEGYEMQPGESLISPRNMTITPGYFQSMGIPVVRGRDFDEHDTETSPGVIIIDERLARKFWPNQDPIGKRMYMPADPQDLLKVDEHTKWLNVAGVVREVRMEDLAGSGNKAGAYYFPFAQNPQSALALTIKSSTDPAALVRAIRAEIAKIDPEIPLFEIRTMIERTELSLVSRKTAMLLALAFAGVALFLSAVGIYGVLAYLVAQRTREIGIRIALGSTATGVFKLVLREGMLLVMSGLLLGLIGVVGLRGAIQNQIYGIQPLDPLVLSIVIASLAAVALGASVLPARRATRVDPVIVLNEQ